MADAGTLEKVLGHIHNWFEYDEIPVGHCAISDGALPASVNIPSGAWFRIQGSLFNDGLHSNPAADLVDETFDGTITVCAVPKSLLDVVDEIEQWIEDTSASDEAARKARYQSESFGGYTYTLKGDSRAGDGSGGLTGWQAAFATDLNQYRKIA